MPVWALADLHLSISVPEKDMSFFGPSWNNYQALIQENWIKLIKSDDLVLIPGDITWAMKSEHAKIDLEWIDALPGKKLILKGNHDYWWGSLSKLKTILPPSIHPIQNNVFNWQDISVAGSRLWDTSEYSFGHLIDYKENPRAKTLATEPADPQEDEKIFQRELLRLETSLKLLSPKAKIRIAMTHYPPINQHLEASRASTLLEKYQVDFCVFGHLHNLKPSLPSLFGVRNGVHYIFCAADYLKFVPIKICD